MNIKVEFLKPIDRNHTCKKWLIKFKTSKSPLELWLSSFLFFGLTSSSSSTRGRFKLSASFNGFVNDSFNELFTVSVASPDPPSLDSLSLEVLADVLSAGALVDTFAVDWEIDWLGVSGFSSVSTVFLFVKRFII